MGSPSVAFTQMYQDTIALLAQQMSGRLRPCVMVDTNFTGSAKYYDQYGADSMVEISTRYQDTPVQSPNHARRKVTPRYFVSNTLEDPADALQMLADPKSAYMQGKQAAAGRQLDDLIISALGATAYTGVAGGTSTTLVSYNSGSSVIASGSAGMTKAKLLAARKQLGKDEVDKEDRFCIYTEEQMDDLLNTTEVTSSDFNSVKALVQGELNTWIGFNFVHSERLATNASSERLCYCYQKKGIQLAIQKEVEGRLSERPDKNYAWQVYLRLCAGATRLEECRVIQVACTE
jgi:hypothetical protein